MLYQLAQQQGIVLPQPISINPQTTTKTTEKEPSSKQVRIEWDLDDKIALLRELDKKEKVYINLNEICLVMILNTYINIIGTMDCYL